MLNCLVVISITDVFTLEFSQFACSKGKWKMDNGIGASPTVMSALHHPVVKKELSRLAKLLNHWSV